MKKTIIYLINFYQKNLFKKHSTCVFIPSCSEYTKQAIVKYGVVAGLWIGVKRILRCHPWQKNHFDPIKQQTHNNKRHI